MLNKYIANPIVMFLAIGIFIFIYYINDPWPAQKKEDSEVERENVIPPDPNLALVAGEQNQPPLENQQEQLNQQGANEFFVPGEQQPVVIPEEIPLNQQVVNSLPQVIPQAQANNSFQMEEKIFQEGHWIGLEVIPLTGMIAKANNIPADVSGVLIDEVTLLAAESGLLAGDVITAVNGKGVSDLKTFRDATKDNALSNQASVKVYRTGGYRDFIISGAEALGFAQMEAAPMILSTARSPHPYYGPCDRCHTISKGAGNPQHLAKDMGDSLILTAPPIKAGAIAPHRDRGACKKCHQIL
jgi:hypothetical protein